MGLRRYVRSRLHRRLFAWFGLAIFATVAAAGFIAHLVGRGPGAFWREDMERARAFAGGRFARVWDAPVERAELAEAAARELGMGVTLVDAAGGLLGSFGPACGRRVFELPVERQGSALGTVRVCWGPRGRFNPLRMLLPLAVAGAVLWAFAGSVARRLARPLAEVARVAQEIGAGKLDARARIAGRDSDEVRAVAVSINDMAERIQKQLADQRALLAAVSHELRTPLSRIRLLVELARSNGADAKTLDELDREAVEIDQLVGELLAGSRIDFAAIAPRPLDAAQMARRALERAGLPATLLSIEAGDTAIQGDPTLLARALANLIDNAAKHGGGLRALRVVRRNGAIAFEADDAGAGFAAGEQELAFEPFHRPDGQPERAAGSLGLGLSLVRRIAEAHGGRAYAQNRPEGGARVGFEVAVRRGQAGSQRA